jgi:hypothetical protein
MPDRLRERSLRAYVALQCRALDARGQTASEYMGVLLIVSVIIAAIATTGIGHDLTHRLSQLVQDISGGKSGK